MRTSGFRFTPRRLLAFRLCAANLTAAQQPTPAQANALRQACRFDYIRHCTGVPTGVSGATNQNANAYSRWGSSQISGPNQTVNTRSETTAQGSAGAFKSTSGAEGAGVHGAGGNNAGVVEGPGGNVYAGANGNVYQHTSSGWEKYDDGSWNPVTRPSNPNAAPGPASGAGARQSSTGGATGQQLDQDRFARTEGGQRFGQYGEMRGGGFGAGRFAGGGFGGFRGRR